MLHIARSKRGLLLLIDHTSPGASPTSSRPISPAHCPFPSFAKAPPLTIQRDTCPRPRIEVIIRGRRPCKVKLLHLFFKRISTQRNVDGLRGIISCSKSLPATPPAILELPLTDSTVIVQLCMFTNHCSRSSETTYYAHGR